MRVWGKKGLGLRVGWECLFELLLVFEGTCFFSERRSAKGDLWCREVV